MHVQLFLSVWGLLGWVGVYLCSMLGGIKGVKEGKQGESQKMYELFILNLFSWVLKVSGPTPGKQFIKY